LEAAFPESRTPEAPGPEDPAPAAQGPQAARPEPLQPRPAQKPAPKRKAALAFEEGEEAESEPAARPDLLAISKQVAALAPDLPMGVLHGRLGSQERLEVMEDFRAGRLKILAATTMVEVGVDVPAANVMLVEGAEFFGLAQLHQLRGRIGRGGGQSFFLAAACAPTNEITHQRLSALASHNDGYALAELDLQLRGPGEELGLKQTGWPSLTFAKLPAQVGALPMAMGWAETVWEIRTQWPDSLREGLAAIAAQLAEAAEAQEAPPGRKPRAKSRAKNNAPYGDSDASGDEPPKRGRGRPRKNPVDA
jgi:hypothetical protein